MLKKIKEVFFLLDRKNKFVLFLVISTGFLSSILDLVGVVSIIPFLSLLVEPELLNQNYYLKKANFILNFNTQEFIIFLGFVTFTLIFINQLFRFLSRMLAVYFTRNLIYKMSRNLFNYYLSRPYTFFLAQNKSLLIQKCTSYVESFVAGTLAPYTMMFGQMLTTIIILSFLFFYEPLITTTISIVLIIYYFIFFKNMNKKLNESSKNHSKYFEGFAKSLGDAFGLIQQLKLLKNKYFKNNFDYSANLYRKSAISQHFFSYLPAYFIEVIAFGSILAISLILYFQSYNLQNIIPVLGVITLSLKRLIPSIQEIYNQILQIKYHAGIYNKIYFDLKKIKTFKDDEDINSNSNKINFDKAIEIKDLNFKYKNSKNKIKISLKINKGEFIGICGKTGVGKSTFINIFSGLLSKNKGDILIDNKLINVFENDQWKRKIGYATQERYIINDTIINNISLGEKKQKNYLKFIKKICKIVDLDKTISQLDLNYNTRLGANGVRFSGGQEQKIILARALYIEPEIIIFDEATNALDTVSETKILKNIKKNFKNTTVIFVTHRLNSLKNCDKIAFIENSKIKRFAKFNDLLAKDSNFKKLIQSNKN